MIKEQTDAGGRLGKWQQALHLIANIRSNGGRTAVQNWFMAYEVKEIETERRKKSVATMNDDSKAWILHEDLCAAVAKEALFGVRSNCA